MTLWTFEIEGPGYSGGYYTPAESWSRADLAAMWLANALWDFDAIAGDRETVTTRRRAELAPIIEQVDATSTWTEGGHTVTVLWVYPSSDDPAEMGSMEARRTVRARQRLRAENLRPSAD